MKDSKLVETLLAVKKEYDEGLITSEEEMDTIVMDLIDIDTQIEIDKLGDFDE